MANDLAPFTPMRGSTVVPADQLADWVRGTPEQRQHRAARRDVLLSQYGSDEAVLAPCERERLLMAAVAPWRVPQAPPHERWTYTLGGIDWYFDYQKASAEVLQAIAGAYPMPATFAAAQEECAYWEGRNFDMEACGRDIGDFGLDKVALWRWWLVRDQVEHVMPLTDLRDIITRVEIAFADEGDIVEEVRAAILRDLRSLAARQPTSEVLRQGLISREDLLRQEGEAWTKIGGDR